MAATGIFDEDFAERTVDGEVAEHIAARAVKEMGNRAEDFSLRAFAYAGRAEEERPGATHLELPEDIADEDTDVILVIGAMIGAGLVGLLDDWLKVSKERNLGLNKRAKILGLLVVFTSRSSPRRAM